MRLLGARLALLGCAVLGASSARAALGNVSLELSACPELDEPALREQLALELATLQLERADAGLRVSCEYGEAKIALERGADGVYPIQVRVQLRDTARGARERLVALAATELLAQAVRNDASAPSMRPPPPPRLSPPDDAPAAPPPVRRRRVELFAAGTAAQSGDPHTLLWGGTLGTLVGLSSRWALMFDTRFERGTSTLELADVRWSMLTAFAGPVARLQVARLELMAGAGARAGWLALDARAQAPSEGASLTAPWAGAAIPLRASTTLGVIVPFVGVEAGYVLVPIRGTVDGDAVLLQQRGPWLSGSLGVGIAL